MRAWSRAVALSLTLLVLPSTSAQDVVPPQPDEQSLTVNGPAVLYAHLATTYKFPLSPQVPEERPLDGSSELVGTACTQTALGARTKQSIEGFVVDGLVDYSGEHARSSLDGGLYADLAVENGTLHWYFAFGEITDGVVLPAFASNVVLRTTLYGSRTSGSTSIDETQRLALVETAPANLVGDEVMGGDGTLAVAGDVGGVTVFGARLALPSMTWPEAGVALVIELEHDAPCADGAPQPSPFRWHASPGYWPRVELATQAQLGFAYFTKAIDAGPDLAFHVSVWSPWGRWDLATPLVHVQGPDDVTLEAADQEYRDTQCCGPEARDFTFLWRGGADATPGTYTLTFEDSNAQGTARLVGAVTFEVAAEKEAAGPALAWLLAAFIGFVVVLRRR